MKLLQGIVVASAAIHATNAAVVVDLDHVPRDASISKLVPPQPVRDATRKDLWKRKGGGGSAPKGGGGGSTSPKGTGGGTTGGGGGVPKGSPSSNVGGMTTTGSGPRPAYGAGGLYYGGGGRTPYPPGTKSPGGIAPFFLGGAAIGFLGGAYLYGAYSYPYAHQYYYHNKTTNQNETKPVECVCSANEPCSCDDNGDDAYFRSVIGDGSYEGLNKSVVTVYDNTTDGKNESTILILGSLPNGTTAAGGTEDPNAAGGMVPLLQAAGWWPVLGTALAMALSV